MIIALLLCTSDAMMLSEVCFLNVMVRGEVMEGRVASSPMLIPANCHHERDDLTTLV